LNARIVAASKRDLTAESRAGRFREDLFFRVAVVAIALPPLRERIEDLPALTEHILADLAVRHRQQNLRVAPEVWRMLREYRWPGNVRELANALEHAVVLSAGDTITAEHVPSRVRSREPISDVASAPNSLERLRRQQITRVLRDSASLKEAADRLGINPSTLWRKRKRWGLE
jgi:NtrC-family two-component system response regulator AlgB